RTRRAEPEERGARPPRIDQTVARGDRIAPRAGDHGTQCDRVHRELRRIAKARGGLDLEEAAALREAQALGLWRRYGYGSLIEYMELELGYAPRAALERLRVAHAIVELPQIADGLAQGELSYSAAR